MDTADAIAYDDWHTLLDTHPIFHPPADSQPGRGNPLTAQSLELSTSILTSAQDSDSEHDYVLSGRRQLMALKDADLIVAVGSELRITSLWDTKLGRDTGKSYKVRRNMYKVRLDIEGQYQVLHVPNVDFPIHQLALNPSGKLLAVAGAYQVAVVVLPRAGYTKVVSSSIDCKYASFSSSRTSCSSSVQGGPSRTVLSWDDILSAHLQGRLASVGRGGINAYGHDCGRETQASYRVRYTISD